METYFFVHVDEQLHAVLNYEQQGTGNGALVLYPMQAGRLDIYRKLKEKNWQEQAIHERLFPRSHLHGKWTPFCKDDSYDYSLHLQELMQWTKEELADGIRGQLECFMPSLEHMCKRDLAVLYRHLVRSTTNAALYSA